MKTRLSQAISAALAAGAVSFAMAQGVQPSTQPAAQSDPQAAQAVQNPKDHEQAPGVAIEESKGVAQSNEEAVANPESTPPSSIDYANMPKSNAVPRDLAKLRFTQEPIARPLKSGGDDPLVSGIVTALNNDGSLQGSKITVSSDNGVVTLTGATMTPDQKAKVDQVAVAQAGEGKVIDTVLDSVT